MLTFVGMADSDDVKPVELVVGSANGLELASVGVEGSTGTDGFGGRPSLGRDAG